MKINSVQNSCITVLIVAMIQQVACDVNDTSFTTFYGDTTLRNYYYEYPPKYTWTPSLTSCVIICAWETTCSIANYNHELGTCALMNWRAVLKVLIRNNHNEMPNTVAIMKGKKQLLLSHPIEDYGFSFLNGILLCGRVGGHLSTDEEVILARDNGDWEVCSCGWIDNGSAVYHVSVTSSKCEKFDNVCQTTETSEYNVHCTIE